MRARALGSHSIAPLLHLVRVTRDLELDFGPLRAHLQPGDAPQTDTVSPRAARARAAPGDNSDVGHPQRARHGRGFLPRTTEMFVWIFTPWGMYWFIACASRRLAGGDRNDCQQRGGARGVPRWFGWGFKGPGLGGRRFGLGLGQLQLGLGRAAP